MPRISVVEAAKKLKQPQESFLANLKELGVAVDDSRLTIDEDLLPRVRALQKEKEVKAGGFVEQRVSRTLIRRRSRKKPAAQGAPEEMEATPKAGVEESADSAAGLQEGGAARESLPVPPPAGLDSSVEAGEVPGDQVPSTESTDEASVEDTGSSTGEGAKMPEDDAEALALKGEEREEQREPLLGRMRKLRGTTSSPARVVSRPAAPVAPIPFRPQAVTVAAQAGDKPAAAPAQEARRGRRVVEFSSRDYSSRRRSKEQLQQEMRAERQRRKRGTKDYKSTEITTPKAIKRKIKIEGAIKVGELARRMGIKSNDLIKKLFEMGQMCTINQFLDVDSSSIIAAEYDYEIEDIAVEAGSLFASLPDSKESLKPRHPIVTVMGHVDHGKTTLLDAIRSTNVASGEAGGITQHIGAYKIDLDGRTISFIDTPGHESFTLMRARGAQVTDIVILVVAADDGVMPQTVEAINHAKDAGVPVVVAVNKIDKGEANLDKLYAELAENGLVLESWGGETQYALVSAKVGTGVGDLLEKVLLQADIMELAANPDKNAAGAVLEARLEKGRGPVATMLIKDGTLRVGDPIVAGMHYGRVRFMHNDRGERVDEAGPADPVEVVGLGGVPLAGDRFFVAENEKKAKGVAELVSAKDREARTRRMAKVSLENLFEHIQEGAVKELRIVLKGDVQGSVEAVKDALLKLSTEKVKVNVPHSGVGGVTEGDINFALATEALVIGFNVRPSPEVRKLAQREGVQIKAYSIIYELLDDVKKGMVGLLDPVFKEVYQGRAEVRNTFSISRVGTIAGTYVLDGKMLRDSQVRLLRDSVEIYKGRLISLKRFKDDAKEVNSGYECGMQIENFNDIHVGDIIECHTTEEVAPTLDDPSPGD